MSDKHEDAAADLLIREVDEELRQDQFHALWKKYGHLAVAGAVALVLSVAGYQAFHTWQGRQRAASSLAYAEAQTLIEQGKREQGAAQLGSLAIDGTAGYRVLAEMRHAGLRVEEGDVAGAIAVYDRLAGEADEPYRSLAVLKSAYLKLDAADAAAVETQVAPLAEDQNPWRHSAREVLALAARKRGDEARAVELLRKLADDAGAPQGIRARASEMLAAAKS
ncbi:MAG: tetratricopeptide repeat protein [Magnetospirillum sp.]|nr:tetratricopeptide repeat protein [Magnetospirillum sp.]